MDINMVDVGEISFAYLVAKEIIMRYSLDPEDMKILMQHVEKETDKLRTMVLKRISRAMVLYAGIINNEPSDMFIIMVARDIDEVTDEVIVHLQCELFVD